MNKFIEKLKIWAIIIITIIVVGGGSFLWQQMLMEHGCVPGTTCISFAR